MEAFLHSLKKESEDYKRDAIIIEDTQHDYDAEFERLENAVNVKVFNLPAPMSTVEKTNISRNIKLKPPSVRSEIDKYKKRSKTSFNSSRQAHNQNTFNIDVRRQKPRKSSSRNAKIWVTDEVPPTTMTDNSTFNRINYPNIVFNQENIYGNDDFVTRTTKVLTVPQKSSHHFNPQKFQEPMSSRRPQTARQWKSPVCVRKIERKLTDDELFFDERPRTARVIYSDLHF